MADTITIVNDGKKLFVDYMLGTVSPGTLSFGLFKSNTTVSVTTVYSDLTIWTSGDNSAYAEKSVAAGGWDAATIVTSSGQALITANSGVLTWTMATDTATTAYGYYVATVADALLWACKFENAKTVQYANETIAITPTFRFTQT